MAWMSTASYPAIRAKVEQCRGYRTLRVALDRGEFELYYQPIVATASGRTIGAEAVLRWNRPGHGVVSPDSFIPLAETTGAIVDIGAWVIAAASRQAAAWHRVTGTTDFRMSVNVAARQLESDGLVDLVRQAIADTGVAPSLLRLEVTETGLLRDMDAVAELLQRLKALGVSICVDDFGVGQSSLAYLQRLPIDGLKIDRSFVAALGSTAKAEPLIAGIIGLADALGLDVTSEGIEQEHQANTIAELGCRFAQGHHYGVPMSAADFTSLFIRQQRSRPAARRLDDRQVGRGSSTDECDHGHRPVAAQTWPNLVAISPAADDVTVLALAHHLNARRRVLGTRSP